MYPGEGQRMSNYGLKGRTPAEAAGQWKEITKAEQRIHKNHLAIKGNGTATWPGVDALPGTLLETGLSYFNDARERKEETSIYDRMFHIQYDYNSKLHRDDRQHTVGLDIKSEELARNVPVLSSTEYGRRVHDPLEVSSREHVRIDKVMKGFYRTRGTGIPTNQDCRENALH